MLSTILPIVQMGVILLYVFLIWKVRPSVNRAYKQGWRDGQLRFIELIHEFAQRPDVKSHEVYFSAVTAALDEDPEVGKTHLPWYGKKPKKVKDDE